MSRSYRKQLARRMNDQFYKRLVHRKNRAMAKQGIYLSSKQYKHVVDDWDICDYVPNAIRHTSYWIRNPHGDRGEWYAKFIRWLRMK